MNQDVFLMHFKGRICQQNSRIPVFVRKLFVYFVIRKEIEHKNVKRQVLELLSANGSLKKSQPGVKRGAPDFLSTEGGFCSFFDILKIATWRVYLIRQSLHYLLCFRSLRGKVQITRPCGFCICSICICNALSVYIILIYVPKFSRWGGRDF